MPGSPVPGFEAGTSRESNLAGHRIDDVVLVGPVAGQPARSDKRTQKSRQIEVITSSTPRTRSLLSQSGPKLQVQNQGLTRPRSQ